MGKVQQKPRGCKIARKMNIFNEKNNLLGSTNFKLMRQIKKFNKLLESAVAELVEASCYKPKDHGFKS